MVNYKKIMFFVKVAMKKKKNKGFWKTLALFLVCIMSIFTLSACMGMGGGLYGSGSSSGGSSGGSSGETPGGSSGGSEPSKPDDPKDDQESTYIDDYNDVFLGGIISFSFLQYSKHFSITHKLDKSEL